MKRRDMLVGMAGMAGGMMAAGWGRSGWGAWRQSPEELSLPELMRTMMPMIGQVPIKTQTLGPDLTMVTGPGGNITALDGPDGLILVDSFVSGHVAALLTALGKPAEGKPITLINTHWHFDHAGGNAELGKLGAKIMAHSTVRTRLGSNQEVADLELKFPPSPPVALPVLTIEEEATLYQNGETLHLTHVPPAHTDGDVFIHYANADVLHTGDLFSNGFYPNIDQSSRGWIGGMIAGVDTVLGLIGPKTRVVPGHGPLGSKVDLAAYRSMLAQARDAIEPLVEAGKTLAEAIASQPLARLDPEVGWRPVQGAALHDPGVQQPRHAAARSRRRQGLRINQESVSRARTSERTRPRCPGADRPGDPKRRQAGRQNHHHRTGPAPGVEPGQAGHHRQPRQPGQADQNNVPLACLERRISQHPQPSTRPARGRTGPTPRPAFDPERAGGDLRRWKNAL